MNTLKQNQTGAALIICLMMLTIATLVGLSAVSSTVLEEKMAGNIRNKHLSFQSAEAGLRAGELVGSGLTETTAFVGASGLYPRSKPGDVDGNPGVYATYPAWDTIASSDWVDITNGTGLPTFPQFIIEDFGEMPLDESCGHDIEDLTCDRPVYRITARAEGLNSNSVTMIQSTYKSL